MLNLYVDQFVVADDTASFLLLLCPVLIALILLHILTQLAALIKSTQ